MQAIDMNAPISVIKETAPIDISRRRFDRFIYQPEFMTWESAVPNAPLYTIVYQSAFSWQKDPIAELQTPLIHYIVFDFDSQILDLAQQDAINFVRYLATVHEVDIACLGLYFSGSKGFHVQLPIGLVVEQGEGGLWGVSPAVIKTFAMRIATGFGTFDMSVYDARRIFRAPNAINPNSGLFKIPLTWQELTCLSTSDIRALASDQKDLIELVEPVVSRSLFELMLTASETGSDLSHKPTIALSDLFDAATSGQRNTRATQLAGLMVKATTDLLVIREVMRLWNRHNPAPLAERELDIIVTGVYQRYTHNHPHQRSTIHVAGF